MHLIGHIPSDISRQMKPKPRPSPAPAQTAKPLSGGFPMSITLLPKFHNVSHLSFINLGHWQYRRSRRLLHRYRRCLVAPAASELRRQWRKGTIRMKRIHPTPKLGQKLRTHRQHLSDKV
ncbi:hypothetical protein Nepgr_008934 [Nepenthes gracilis]|uniref:Uncharacterized protein n=1 Tax=Nepenthes gracilis TaxID=150966 RepID=A0AAD3XJR8_NEPGR|nr:hypothetical protein Nepgr_008934 [Nepenthes gracilis]